MRGDLPAQLMAKARAQSSVVSRAQVLHAKLSDEFITAQLGAGRWNARYPGVYVTHSGDLSRNTELWAALLYAGPGACLSHETGAEHWGLIDRQSKLLHITVPVTRRIKAQDGLRIHYANRLEHSRHPSRSIPVTRVEDTVLDLIDASTKFGDVVDWLTRSCQREKTNPGHLLDALATRKKIRWRRDIERILADVEEGVDSPLELAYLRRVERAHGLPRGLRRRHQQVEGRSQWIDVLYEKFRLIVELDGRLGHTELGKFRDHRRDNAAAVEGRETLRYGWTDTVSESCSVAVQVGVIMRRNGWKGMPKACGPSCILAEPDQAA